VAEKKPGQEIGNLAWTRLGPFTAAPGQRYVFDPTGAWGVDTSPSVPKITPGDCSIKFRNVSGKNPVLFCVEGPSAPQAGGRKWKRHDPGPPRIVDIVIYLKGDGLENEHDTEMPKLDKVNVRIKITIDVEDDNLEPEWIGDTFLLDQYEERGNKKASRIISGMLSSDGLTLKELYVSHEEEEAERDELTEEETKRGWSFTARNLPLVDEDEEEGTLEYHVSSVETDLPPAPYFSISQADYSLYMFRKNPDKTWTWTKDHFDMAQGEYTLIVTLKSNKD
jgi:hypothetical protein